MADGTTSFIMVIVKVIGEACCVVGDDVAGDTSTMRAVLVRGGSGFGSGLGAGFSPWRSSFRSSSV